MPTDTPDTNHNHLMRSTAQMYFQFSFEQTRLLLASLRTAAPTDVRNRMIQNDAAMVYTTALFLGFREDESMEYAKRVYSEFIPPEVPS